eukprot:94729-Prymnesium_polylepis.1
MDDHLERCTQTFCECMFDLCQLIKGIRDNDEEAALHGLRLIAAVRGLFAMGIRVPMDCPVNELFNVEFKRLKASLAPDVCAHEPEAAAAWEALEAANGIMPRDEWRWDGELKEWMPIMLDGPDSSGDEE